MRTQTPRTYGPTMHAMSSTTTRISSFEPRVVERSRGTAHPTATQATRERVARSLMLHPDPVTARPVGRLH